MSELTQIHFEVTFSQKIQTIFQAYALSDVDDHYEYQVIEINTIQSIRKYLNVTCNI